jgi:HSP20 family protein
MANTDRNGDRDRDAAPNFGGLLDGMSNLLGKLGELAEKGEQLRQSGNFQSDDGKTVAGSYGFSVRFGPGGQRSDEVNVAPVQKPAAAETSAVKPEAREPQVDTFVESDHILVVAEMPGVRVEDIRVEFSGNDMTLTGESPRVRFKKQIDLGRTVSPDDVAITINNGVVEIQLQLPDSDGDSSSDDTESRSEQ